MATELLKSTQKPDTGRSRYKSLPLRTRETIVSYAFLAPALFFFVTFVVVPMGTGLVTSFFDYTNKKFAFSGFDN